MADSVTSESESSLQDVCTEESKCYLQYLPPEIFQYLVKFMELAPLKQLRCTSSWFYETLTKLCPFFQHWNVRVSKKNFQAMEETLRVAMMKSCNDPSTISIGMTIIFENLEFEEKRKILRENLELEEKRKILREYCNQITSLRIRCCEDFLLEEDLHFPKLNKLEIGGYIEDVDEDNNIDDDMSVNNDRDDICYHKTAVVNDDTELIWVEDAERNSKVSSDGEDEDKMSVQSDDSSNSHQGSGGNEAPSIHYDNTSDNDDITGSEIADPVINDENEQMMHDAERNSEVSSNGEDENDLSVQNDDHSNSLQENDDHAPSIGDELNEMASVPSDNENFVSDNGSRDSPLGWELNGASDEESNDSYACGCRSIEEDDLKNSQNVMQFLKRHSNSLKSLLLYDINHLDQIKIGPLKLTLDDLQISECNCSYSLISLTANSLKKLKINECLGEMSDDEAPGFLSRLSDLTIHDTEYNGHEEDLLKLCHNSLTNLEISCHALDWLEFPSYPFPNLQKIDVRCEVDMMKMLTSCHESLLSLTIRCCNEIRFPDLSLKNLQYLKLDNCPVDISAVLKQVGASLRTLDMSDVNNVGTSEAGQYFHLPKLERLVMGDCLGASLLSSCSETLTCLTLTWTGSSRAYLFIPNLKHLIGSFDNPTAVEFIKRHSSNLVSLELERMYEDPKKKVSLHCPSLKYLNCKETVGDLSSISWKLPNLKDLLVATPKKELMEVCCKSVEFVAVLDDLKECCFDWESLFFPNLQIFMAPFHSKVKAMAKLRGTVPKTARMLMRRTGPSEGILENRVGLVRENSYCQGICNDIDF
eukprot:TRINITY_DN1369_c0_g2_i10.p1 TRINITY_DN1369_c0_g2~~TRINITY_DN1369_c0_g2_i10.p1  ORF type:complete len:815 (+),score=107.54 TRINITY_DN1369_c0_g2_i10:41-2485(+)